MGFCVWVLVSRFWFGHVRCPGTALPLDRPSPGPLQISLFFPSPAAKFVLFFPLWGSSRGILVVFLKTSRLHAGKTRVWNKAGICLPNMGDLRPEVWWNAASGRSMWRANPLAVRWTPSSPPLHNPLGMPKDKPTPPTPTH